MRIDPQTERYVGVAQSVDLSTRARLAILLIGTAVAIASVLVSAAALRVLDGGGEAETGAPVGTTRMEQLQLDREQRRAWSSAWRAHRKEIFPALDEVSDLRASLREELAREPPDAETVGHYVIAIQERRKSVGAAREDLDASLDEILDSDQRERYEELKASSRGAE